MPITLRNTDILFNDGTTQSTAASLPAVVAGTRTQAVGVRTVSGPSVATIAGVWYTGNGGILILQGGTIRIRLRYSAAYYNDGETTNYASTSYQLIVSGTPVGQTYSPPANGQVFVATQDITVSTNNIIYIRALSNSSGYTFNSDMMAGVNSTSQVQSFVGLDVLPS